jgi:hypothetical protein
MLRCTARIDAGRILIIVLCIVLCRFEIRFTCNVVSECVWWSGPVCQCGCGRSYTLESTMTCLRVHMLVHQSVKSSSNAEHDRSVEPPPQMPRQTNTVTMTAAGPVHTYL